MESIIKKGEGKLHIVFVTTEFVTDKNFHGGLATFTANMATIFAKHNHKVTVLVAGKNNKEKCIDWIDKIAIKYIEFNKNYIFAGIADYIAEKSYESYLTDLYFKYRGVIINNEIRKIHKKCKIDIVHYCNLLATGLYPLKSVPYVIRMSSFPGMSRHAEQIDFDRYKVINDLNRLEKLELAAIKKTKAVISPSKINADFVYHTIHKKIQIIESPFYLDMNNWDDMVYNDILSEKNYFLFYGCLCRKKGLHIIDEIIYRLLDEHKDMLFVFIGKDYGIIAEKKKYTKAFTRIKMSAKEYADRVVYINTIPREKLFPIIKNASVCVLPSIVDNLPNTCIEAMALGKIVIGSKGASFDQLIKDGNNGLLCERASSASLYEALERFCKLTPAQVEAMGEKAKLKINELNPQKVYSNYMKYYRYVMNHKK